MMLRGVAFTAWDRGEEEKHKYHVVVPPCAAAIRVTLLDGGRGQTEVLPRLCAPGDPPAARPCARECGGWYSCVLGAKCVSVRGAELLVNQQRQSF